MNKIIFISGSHNIYGGGQVYISNLSDELKKKGISNVILSSDNIFPNSIPIPRIDSWKLKFKNIKSIINIIKAIDKEKNSIIITNDITLSMLSILFKVRKWKTIPIIHMSLYNTSKKSKFIRIIYPLIRALFIRIGSHKILSVNIENKKLLGKKNIYIGNFTTDKPHKTNYKDIDYLYVGRFDKEKRPDKFVDIMHELSNKKAHFHAVMIGDGVLFNDIKNKITDLGLVKKITLTGFLDKNDIINYYKRANYLIISSKTEGLPTVILDAAAYNVNFLAPAIGSIPFINKKWDVGCIASIEDMPNILLNSDEILNKNKSNLVKLVRDHSLDRFTNNFIEEVMK